MKILHITQSYGGVQSYICNIIEYAPGFEYAIACHSEQLIKIFESKNHAGYWVDFTREVSPAKDYKALVQLVKIIKDFNPDVIHVHSAKGGALGRIAGVLTGKKVIFTPNAFSFLGFNGFKRKLYLIIEKALRPFTHLLLAVSNSEKNRAVAEAGYSADKVKVIDNAILAASRAKKRNDNFAVGMIGRLTFQKNPLMFLNVAEKVHETKPDIKFYLLGEGYLDSLKDSVYQYIQTRNIHYVDVLKWGDSKISESFFSLIDVFILTSEFEGLPFALLEAMDNGLPCVVTDADGNRDVIQNGGDGFIVNNHDSNAMAQKIIELYENMDLYNCISHNAMNKIKTSFNADINYKELEKIYLSMKN